MKNIEIILIEIQNSKESLQNENKNTQNRDISISITKLDEAVLWLKKYLDYK